MELIRKNWGLLTVSMLCLAGAIFLALQLLGATKKAKESKGELAKEVEFFSGVKTKNIKLTETNKLVALQNADSATKRFQHARKQLHKTFRIEVSYDPDAYVAVQQLLARVDKMRNKLLAAGIQLSAQHAFLSFDAYDPKIGDTPNVKQMPEIFRQLNIVEEVVKLVVESKVAGLNEISRPMQLEKKVADLYSYVPVRLSVTGTSDSVQDLLNRFHKTSKYLFFVRNIESLTSQDQAPGGVLGGTGTTGGAGGRSGMGGGGMGGGAMDGGAMDGGGMPGAGAGAGGGMPGSGPGGDMGLEGGRGAGGNALAMATLLTRDQLKAFQDRYVTAVIRLDLVEFNAPEQPEE